MSSEPVPFLLPLSPLGLGTPACESVSSYVQRLAAAHGVNPGQLLYRVLAWCEQGQPDRIGCWCDKPRRLRSGFNINGYAHADAWVRALQRATLRADLHYLSTRTWDHLFPPRGFLASHLRWCPRCLADDSIPYHRLAWMLQAVRVCDKHACTLLSKCASCWQAIPVLHERSLTTHCPWCDASLNAGAAAIRTEDYEASCAKQIGAIIAQSANWHRPPAWEPSTDIRLISKQAGLATPAHIARVLQTSKVTVWYWLKGKSRPTLPMALDLYSKLGASLASRIFGTAPDKGTQTQPVFHFRPKRIVRPHDWAQIRDRLLRELASPTTNSLRTICRDVQLAVRAMRGKLPALCRSVVAARRRQQRQRLSKQECNLRKAIGHAAAQLASDGEEITLKRIEYQLARPGLFNSRAGRRALGVPPGGPRPDPNI